MLKDIVNIMWVVKEPELTRKERSRKEEESEDTQRGSSLATSMDRNSSVSLRRPRKLVNI